MIAESQRKMQDSSSLARIQPVKSLGLFLHYSPPSLLLSSIKAVSFPCSVGTCIELATVADSKLKFFAWEIPAFGLFQVNILVACATEQRTPPTALGSVSKQVQTRKQALCWSPLFWLPWNLNACLSPGGLHRWFSGKESACHYRRGGFDPRIRKIP